MCYRQMNYISGAILHIHARRTFTPELNEGRISYTDAMTLELPPGFEIPKHSLMGKDSPKIGEADSKVDGRGVKGEGSPGLAKVKKGSKLETVASTLGDAKLDGHGVKGEQNPGLAKVNKGSKSETVASMLGDKLWDGNLQLSSTVTASALAFFKSGEKIPVINWAESLAVKGKVRLDAFKKYIQDLPRSHNRGFMVRHCVFRFIAYIWSFGMILC
ncbi:hypothetical protein Droror1_Dr00011351 [Drosera rotundifolia]